MRSLLSRILRRPNQEMKVVIDEGAPSLSDEEDGETIPYVSDDPFVTQNSIDSIGGPSPKESQTITHRRDPSCIVIGIYGAWGEGKTTVLNFVQRELEKHDNVITVKFNPWRFLDENQLLRSFFSTLADALGKSMSTMDISVRRSRDVNLC